ncbi:MAG: HEPN domain-containing protein [Candidatus Omnitrophota bacterium]
MNQPYQDCLKKGKIKQFSRGKALISKELETATSDLERAKKTYADEDYKWATIQIYYAMFHSARALLYAKNLREHSHYCLIVAIKELYVVNKQLSVDLLEALQEAKDLREEADYYHRWSKQGCEKLLKSAQDFLIRAKVLVFASKA